MDEKKRNIWIGCTIVGIVAILIYSILKVIGSNTVLFALRIIFAEIAVIAYAIRMGTEISSDDSYGTSVLIIAICLFAIVISAMQS